MQVVLHGWRWWETGTSRDIYWVQIFFYQFHAARTSLQLLSNMNIDGNGQHNVGKGFQSAAEAYELQSLAIDQALQSSLRMQAYMLGLTATLKTGCLYLRFTLPHPKLVATLPMRAQEQEVECLFN